MSPRARGWGTEPPPAPHIWQTLGYRGIAQADGLAVIEWDATVDYCFNAARAGRCSTRTRAS
jgi:hypothetical protein